MATKLEAAKAYVEALRSGDHAAAAGAAPHLAPDIVVNVGQRTFTGYDEALKRITGAWPNTPVYVKGDWSDIREAGDQVRVEARMRPVGAGPKGVNLTFAFNDANQIVNVTQEIVPGVSMVETSVIPDFIRRRVDGALANDTPICVGYVNEAGQPVLSLRGSTQVYSDNQICLWIRQGTGGLARSIASNPAMSLLYRDSSDRTTLIFTGQAHVETDDETRRRVWDLIQEVEQNHESWENGVPVILDLEKLEGATPDGRVRIAWPPRA